MRIITNCFEMKRKFHFCEGTVILLDIPYIFWELPQICLRYGRYMSKIYLRFAGDLPELCLRKAWDLPEIFLRFASDLTKIHLRYARDMPEIYLRYAWNMTEILLTFVWDFPIHSGLLNLEKFHLRDGWTDGRTDGRTNEIRPYDAYAPKKSGSEIPF